MQNEHLAAPARPLDDATGQGGVDAGSDDERVGALDREHPAADERLGGAPGQLDLEDLRHRPSLPDPGWHAQVMTSVLWIVGAVVVSLGLLYVAYSIEPHWVAKDGRRFLATSEIVDRHGTPVGRRREVRGSIHDDGTVVLGKRALLRTRHTEFHLRGKSPQESRGRQQYVLEPVPPDPAGDLMILRIPHDSRLTARLDAMAEGSAEEA